MTSPPAQATDIIPVLTRYFFVLQVAGHLWITQVSNNNGNVSPTPTECLFFDFNLAPLIINKTLKTSGFFAMKKNSTCLKMARFITVTFSQLSKWGFMNMLL